ncbi:hypothetical protein ROZALSC1DRAFT_23207 [Rozella allomycis CSF55]|uniref:Uncharacterized protein n=1 Tax=Rozella allomycis (strain CSF55) TaxID=988480 RepID=A0A4P9YG52_ROZAC|nr:hypothetical protein ROZALSC1DRAFT_23207 [Rozella allomycis CSF55]
MSVYLLRVICRLNFGKPVHYRSHHLPVNSGTINSFQIGSIDFRAYFKDLGTIEPKMTRQAVDKMMSWKSKTLSAAKSLIETSKGFAKRRGSDTVNVNSFRLRIIFIAKQLFSNLFDNGLKIAMGVANFKLFNILHRFLFSNLKTQTKLKLEEIPIADIKQHGNISCNGFADLTQSYYLYASARKGKSNTSKFYIYDTWNLIRPSHAFQNNKDSGEIISATWTSSFLPKLSDKNVTKHFTMKIIPRYYSMFFQKLRSPRAAFFG